MIFYQPLETVSNSLYLYSGFFVNNYTIFFTLLSSISSGLMGKVHSRFQMGGITISGTTV